MTTVTDSGRFPLALRIPCALISGFFVYLLANVVAEGLFQVDLGMGVHLGQSLVSKILAVVACLILSWLFLFCWFARKRILRDEERDRIVIESSGVFRRVQRTMALSDISSVEVTSHVDEGGRTWRIWIRTVRGKGDELLANKVTAEGAARFAENIAKGIGKPVVKTPE